MNLEKSEMVPVGEVRNINCLASFLGCKVASLAMKYLGLPLGHLLRLMLFGIRLLRKLKKNWLL